MKDVNDSPPRFSREEYDVVVDETYGDRLSEDAVLNVTVLDEDEDNMFFYSVGLERNLELWSVLKRNLELCCPRTSGEHCYMNGYLSIF